MMCNSVIYEHTALENIITSMYGAAISHEENLIAMHAYDVLDTNFDGESVDQKLLGALSKCPTLFIRKPMKILNPRFLRHNFFILKKYTT